MTMDVTINQDKGIQMKKTDYSKLKTAKAIAKHGFDYLVEWDKATGGSGKYIFLWTPDESKERGYSHAWAVCWESGPYDWAMDASMGSSIGHAEFAAELALEGFTDAPVNRETFPGLCDHPTVSAEPYTSYILQFFNN